MLSVRRKNEGVASVLSLCQTLCICATWARVATALPQEAIESDASIAQSTASFDLLPITGLIPSASILPEPAPSGLITSASRGFGLIPSQAPPTNPIPAPPITSEPVSSGLIPSAPAPIDPEPLPSGLIPSAPVASKPAPSNVIPSATRNLGPIPSASDVNLIPSLTVGPIPPAQTTSYPLGTESHGFGTSMASTDEGLRPIPAPTTGLGDPNGHHEISEPNFSATAPCRGCSPVIEISATGWYDGPTTPIAEHAETSDTSLPSKATITAGPSEVIISKEPTGGNFVIGGSTTTDSAGHTTVVDKTTVSAGQTVIIDNTPVVIQTSGGSTEVVIGTSTVPITLQPESPDSPLSQITSPPLLAPVVLGSQTLTANSLSQYFVSGQTLVPGGLAITVDGTTISLLPSASALVVNGVTTTLTQPFYDAVYTSLLPPLLTLFNNQVFTANRAGYYVLAPGTTLVPGGPAVTVSGSTVSLEPHGTAVIVQGTTSNLTPATTVVTVTRPGGYGGLPYSGLPYSYSSGVPLSTGRLPPVSKGMSARMGGGGLLEGAVLLGMMGIGWLAIWL
ncbi:hypothetical protein K505DRAFT_419981 [Melanomma pulvis-pyrius CBS 109.77]|uniref:Uncharacterized protein n=1 Tax=Melanomma pulvis-pyrius CBS 109.77 TaxID=1314802 RepID=A0A6A6X1Y0_9PLEO|nr:hypothetical protein K505DRAFT_419981 [Melanomma pulvis-pyrius CBS 109.77]